MRRSLGFRRVGVQMDRASCRPTMRHRHRAKPRRQTSRSAVRYRAVGRRAVAAGRRFETDIPEQMTSAMAIVNRGLVWQVYPQLRRQSRPASQSTPPGSTRPTPTICYDLWSTVVQGGRSPPTLGRDLSICIRPALSSTSDYRLARSMERNSTSITSFCSLCVNPTHNGRRISRAGSVSVTCSAPCARPKARPAGAVCSGT